MLKTRPNGWNYLDVSMMLMEYTLTLTRIWSSTIFYHLPTWPCYNSSSGWSPTSAYLYSIHLARQHPRWCLETRYRAAVDRQPSGGLCQGEGLCLPGFLPRIIWHDPVCDVQKDASCCGLDIALIKGEKPIDFTSKVFTIVEQCCTNTKRGMLVLLFIHVYEW